MKVLFLHGLESEPGGSKVEHLMDRGHTVFNPALPRDSFEESMRIAQEEVDTNHPDVIVGSSRGGAVAMSIDPAGARLVLIAPAWQHFGASSDVPPGTNVLHCTTDEQVPFSGSEELEGANLIPCGESHRMIDSGALDTMAQAVEGTLKTESILREYIRELLEAGELGRQVFADRAPHGRHHGTERDTELEEEIWSALWSHLQGVSRKVPKNLLDAMVSFSKDPAYNDVFMLYEGGDAYRGLGVTPEYLDENAPGWREAKFPEKKGHYRWSDVIPVDFEYQSRDASNTVSSWTPSEGVAADFGREQTREVGIILIADSATNTFLDLKELYMFHRLDDFGWEEEIVGFGSIRVKGVKVGKKLRLQ